MQLQGYIVNRSDKSPIPFATVQVFSGNVLLRSHVADPQGNFSVLMEPGTTVKFSSAEYYPLSFPYLQMEAAMDVFYDFVRIELTAKNNLLNEVVVTSTRPDRGFWLLAAGLAVAVAASQKKKQPARINGVGDYLEKNKTTILWGGAVIIGGSILYKLLQAVGIVESKDERQSREAREQAYKQSRDQILSTQTPTKSIAEWKIIADIIYNDLKFSSIADNKEDAGYQISRPQNDADLLILADMFGVRQEYWFGLPMYGKQDFFQFVHSNLSRSKLDAVNNNYASKGIKFRW